MTNKTLLIAFAVVQTLAISVWAEEGGTGELLSKIEANTAYKDVLKSGFNGKQKDLDIAVLEVMSTKQITEDLSDKMNEDQLDLAGLLMAYGKQAKKFPEGLIKAFRESPNSHYMMRKFSGWGPTTEGSNTFAPTTYCFAGAAAVIAYPQKFDRKLDTGDFAQVVALEDIEAGKATVNFVARRFITKTKPKTLGEFYSAQETKYPTAVNVSANEMNPKVIESVMKEHKAKQVILDIPHSQITSVTEEKDGIAIAAWNSKNPGHSYLVKIPMKKALEHSKMGGWLEGDKPGCDEDELHVVATFEGTEKLPNKLGQVLVVPVFKAKSVFDEYDFYGE